VKAENNKAKVGFSVWTRWRYVVHIERANGLRKADTFGLSDPYVVVRYGKAGGAGDGEEGGDEGKKKKKGGWFGKGRKGEGEIIGKTRHINRTLNPSWTGESFALPVTGSVEDLQDDEQLRNRMHLHLELFDYDMGM
jgi:hypothetical protein